MTYITDICCDCCGQKLGTAEVISYEIRDGDMEEDVVSRDFFRDYHETWGGLFCDGCYTQFLLDEGTW